MLKFVNIILKAHVCLRKVYAGTYIKPSVNRIQRFQRQKSCKTCQQSFQSGTELRNHEKIHDNEDFQLQQKTQPPDMMMKMIEDIMQRLAALEKAISSK